MWEQRRPHMKDLNPTHTLVTPQGGTDAKTQQIKTKKTSLNKTDHTQMHMYEINSGSKM